MYMYSVSVSIYSVLGPILENFKDFHLNALVLLQAFLIFYNQSHTTKNYSKMD